MFENKYEIGSYGDFVKLKFTVVYCEFGLQHGGGFLALLSSDKVYKFGGHDCYIVYIPTSPIPMSGGIVFVPLAGVQKVEMEVEHLMQIYLSLGVMSEAVVPDKYSRDPLPSTVEND